MRATTDADFYAENSESVELRSPGSPVFPAVDEVASTDEFLSFIAFGFTESDKDLNPVHLPTTPGEEWRWPVAGLGLAGLPKWSLPAATDAAT